MMTYPISQDVIKYAVRYLHCPGSRRDREAKMDSSIPEVVPTLVADQVFQVLREKILTGELESGSPLRVRNLAKMVGTSVMPVRDAIRRLEDMRLVTSVPHRGAVVRQFTTNELMHIYEVRGILEVEAATMGARHVTESDIEVMNAAADRMEQAVARQDANEALDEDEVIHRVLYAANNNPVLVEIVEKLWLQCRPYKYIGAVEAMNKDDMSLWTSQREIIRAVSSRKQLAVASLIDQSLTSARRRLEERLQRERAQTV